VKAVALLLLYAGYAVLAYGVDHVANGCTPFKCVIWLNGNGCTGNSIKCAGASSSSSGVGAAPAQAPPLPGSGSSGTDHPTTITSPGPNVHITNGGASAAGVAPQGAFRPGNPYGLSYTTLSAG
jgi:hypothetical protein